MAHEQEQASTNNAAPCVLNLLFIGWLIAILSQRINL